MTDLGLRYQTLPYCPGPPANFTFKRVGAG